MVNKKLLDSYESLNKQDEIYKTATRQPYFIIFLTGFIIILLSFIPFLPIFISGFFGINILYSIACSLFFGLLLMALSLSFGHILPLPTPLSINEQKFFKVVESLKDIENYLNQKEKINFSKIQAAKKLSKIEKKIKAPPRNDYSFWKALMKENIDSLGRFKFYFKKRLIPNLIKGNDEDLIKVYAIIEKFAKFLLEPTLSELKVINENMSDLNEFPSEESQLKLFIIHPYMKHAYILIFFIICGYSVYFLGLKVGASIDTSYTVGIGLFGTLIAGYLVLIFSKKI